MNIRRVLDMLARTAFSILFGGLFYTGWMAVSIPVFKAELGRPVLTALLWLLAPIATAVGFATGVKMFELRPGARKSKFANVLKWSLVGCGVGAAVVVWFGPMLIVFGMFMAGALSVALREVMGARGGPQAR
jgi:hypothetical protein